MPGGAIEVPPRDQRGQDVHLGRVPPRLPPGNGDGRSFREPEPGPLISNAKLGMAMFLSAEAMFFAGLVGAFVVLRASAPLWPPPFQPRLPVLVTGLNTLILLASGVTMMRAVRAVRGADQSGLVSGLRLTAILGALFLAIQGYEWVRLVHFGLTASSGSYGSAFYTLIGAHGVHVFAALTWLAVIWALASRKRFALGNHLPVSLCGMYWLFVVALWPILYLLVYLT